MKKITFFLALIAFLSSAVSNAQDLNMVRERIDSLCTSILNANKNQKLSSEQLKFIRILKEGTNAKNFDENKLHAYGLKIKNYNQNVAKRASPFMVRIRANTLSGEECRKIYDNCMNDLGCPKDADVCICCIPCSLLYGRCITGL